MTMIKAKDNPFRSGRVESMLKFQPQWLGESWDAILDRWETLGRFTSVVGPHGSGKTTFLESIAPRLIQRGYRVQSITIQSLDAPFPSVKSNSVLLFDAGGLRAGHRWRRLARWRLRRRMERQLRGCVGLIETRHRPNQRPTLLCTHTTVDMLTACINTLHQEDTQTQAEVSALYFRHRGNIRSALRECYDKVT